MDTVDATARSIDRSKNNLSLRPKQSGFALIILGLIILIPISGWGSPQQPRDCTPHVLNCDKTSQGTWYNMPACTVVGDSCELFGNSTYRPVLLSSAATPSVGLEVQCSKPSNTLSAKLVLQVANYSSTSGTNATNFINAGTGVTIDGGGASASNPPCPGTGFDFSGVALKSGAGICAGPPTIINCYIFRILGEGGGGSGDNPIISGINILVFSPNPTNTVNLKVALNSTSSFTWQATTWLVVQSASIINVQWIATNSTLTNQCCIQRGFATCTIAIGTQVCSNTVTYPNAFIAGSKISTVLQWRSTAGVPTAVAFPPTYLNVLQPEIVVV